METINKIAGVIGASVGLVYATGCILRALGSRIFLGYLACLCCNKLNHGESLTYASLARLYDSESEKTLLFPGELSLYEAYLLVARIRKRCGRTSSRKELQNAVDSIIEALPSDAAEPLSLGDPMENMALILSVVSLTGTFLVLSASRFLERISPGLSEFLGLITIGLGLLNLIALGFGCIALWPFGLLFVMAVKARLKQLVLRS